MPRDAGVLRALVRPVLAVGETNPCWFGSVKTSKEDGETEEVAQGRVGPIASDLILAAAKQVNGEAERAAMLELVGVADFGPIALSILSRLDQGQRGLAARSLLREWVSRASTAAAVERAVLSKLEHAALAGKRRRAEDKKLKLSVAKRAKAPRVGVKYVPSIKSSGASSSRGRTGTQSVFLLGWMACGGEKVPLGKASYKGKRRTWAMGFIFQGLDLSKLALRASRATATSGGLRVEGPKSVAFFRLELRALLERTGGPQACKGVTHVRTFIEATDRAVATWEQGILLRSELLERIPALLGMWEAAVETRVARMKGISHAEALSAAGEMAAELDRYTKSQLMEASRRVNHGGGPL
jgi:hypothetical protein